MAIGDEYDVSPERVAELTAALEATGAANVDVAQEVTFEMVAERGGKAMARGEDVLLALSWPSVVTATLV
jgi:hypothetical protein